MRIFQDYARRLLRRATWYVRGVVGFSLVFAGLCGFYGTFGAWGLLVSFASIIAGGLIVPALRNVFTEAFRAQRRGIPKVRTNMWRPDNVIYALVELLPHRQGVANEYRVGGAEMIRPGFTIPIAFLVAITIWLIFLRDPPPLAQACAYVVGPSHHGVTPFEQCR